MTFQERINKEAEEFTSKRAYNADHAGAASFEQEAFTAGARLGMKLERERVELLSAAIDSCCKCTEDPLRERHSLLCNIPLVKAEIAKWKECADE